MTGKHVVKYRLRELTFTKMMTATYQTTEDSYDIFVLVDHKRMTAKVLDDPPDNANDYHLVTFRTKIKDKVWDVFYGFLKPDYLALMQMIAEYGESE